MKVNPTILAPTTGATVGGLTWSPQSSGTIWVRSPTNNLGTASTIFQQMNAVIVALDAIFHSLLPGPPGPGNTQADWDLAASGIGARGVCGCADSDLGGQTLFRLVNWMLYVQLAPLDYYAPSSVADIAPPDFVTPVGVAIPPSASYIILDVQGDWLNVTTQWCIGQGVENPVYTLSTVAGEVLILGDSPLLRYLIGRPNGSTVEVCTWAASGMWTGTYPVLIVFPP